MKKLFFKGSAHFIFKSLGRSLRVCNFAPRNLNLLYMSYVNTTLGYVLNNDQQRLVEENWEFAAGVARGYAGGCVPMAELESEAWTALCYAAFKYKKVEGCKFTSYAYYFIRGSILKLLKNESERRAVEVCSVEDDLAEDNLDGDEEWLADDKRLEMLAELMQSLSKREREVVRRYYGVGCEAVTVMELAKELGVTPERVRQILTKAVNKLKILSNQK